jgi:hypothetical protein
LGKCPTVKIRWLLRSLYPLMWPDFTVGDYFLCDYFKNVLFSEQCRCFKCYSSITWFSKQ